MVLCGSLGSYNLDFSVLPRTCGSINSHNYIYGERHSEVRKVSDYYAGKRNSISGWVSLPVGNLALFSVITLKSEKLN